jgi:hypothetical protein
MFLNVRTLLLDVIPSQCRGSGQRGSILSNADAGLVPAITAGILTTEQLDCVQRAGECPRSSETAKPRRLRVYLPTPHSARIAPLLS